MSERQRRDDMEFRELYDRQFKRVYQIAYLLTGSRADAEDVVQQVFVKVWEKQPRFRDDGHENAWFVTVTRNQCHDLQRNYFRRKRTLLEEAECLPAAEASGETGELWSALQELPGKYRIVLYLYYYEGYSVRELAGILRCKESTLQTRLADGRKKLRVLLENEER